MSIQPCKCQLPALKEPKIGVWSLGDGNWSLEAGNGSPEVGNCGLKPPVLFGRSRLGPRFGALVDLARGSRGPNILIDKRANGPRDENLI